MANHELDASPVPIMSSHSNKSGDPRETSRLSADELNTIHRAESPQHSPLVFSVVVYARDGVESISLTEGRSIVLGRSPPADIAIRDDSLSRQHAVLEVVEGALWVEDLGSTNGTWVRGDRCERRTLSPGDEVLFGGVRAVVLEGDARAAARQGLEGHERFRRDLVLEIARARAYRKPFALLAVRDLRRREASPGTWVPAVRSALREFDKMAMYCADAAEILLPEVEEAEAARLAGAIVARSAPLVCGIAMYPRHGLGAEELLDLALSACQRATAETPVELTRARATDPQSTSATRHDAAPVVRAESARRLFAEAARVAQSAIPVLIVGETGTGKEVVARAIHAGGKQAGGPFVCVNCASIPSQLVESTLFGHERGAFTGAVQQAKGVFEAAHGGSVFLDEIGELPAPVQAALLRVLESRSIVRVGSTRELEVDVRVLAATHRDLDSMVREGKFRQDLLYRLNVMTLRVPSLRERVDDIEPLALLFLRQANADNQCSVQGLDPDATALLRRYGWPGNVRELRNAIQRGVVLATGSHLAVEDLPESVREIEALDLQPHDAERPVERAKDTAEMNLRAELSRFESELVLRALQRSDWDRKVAARLLGLPLRTLAHKVQVHGVRKVVPQGGAK